MCSRVRALLAVGLLTAATSPVAAACAGPQRPDRVSLPDGSVGVAATVSRVIDGDTVDLAIEGAATERARLLGIDTPETVKPDHPVECFGPEASDHTKHLLAPGTRVVLQRDQEARDRYGRLLVYLWLADDGRFVNGDLIDGGFADVLDIAPNSAHRSDLAARLATAKAHRQGRWRACPPTP